jgi:aromatic ring-opening dioxygenase catalytic subunit (LigB family)
MIHCLKTIATQLEKPSAILLISAHWEAAVPTVTAAANPPLLYDYSGFPPAAYEITYPCSGHPLLAEEVQQVLVQAGIPAQLDHRRGFDHGLFVPLKIMFPAADIPCVQLSLINHLNPSAHLKLGQALQALKNQQVLVIGSGFSFHNMQAFFAPETGDAQAQNAAFQNWLCETCASTTLSEEERTQRLISWETAPFARFCHPREEHLIPLFVCYGLARTHCTEYFSVRVLNKQSSMFLW